MDEITQETSVLFMDQYDQHAILENESNAGLQWNNKPYCTRLTIVKEPKELIRSLIIKLRPRKNTVLQKGVYEFIVEKDKNINVDDQLIVRGKDNFGKGRVISYVGRELTIEVTDIDKKSLENQLSLEITVKDKTIFGLEAIAFNNNKDMRKFIDQQSEGTIKNKFFIKE